MRRGILMMVLLVAVAAGYRWWSSDERAIRNQLSAIARSLSVVPSGGNLESIARIAALRNALAPDVRLSLGPSPVASVEEGVPAARQVVGRDTVLALVSRWVPPRGGVTVEFVDMQTTVSNDGASAQVYCTGTITSRGASGLPTVDARELTIGLAKLDGRWLVTSVQPEETLRP